MASLEAWRDGVLLSTHALRPGRHTIGRSADADIPADHPSCSRQHAELQVGADGSARLQDLGSAQGTRVNNIELQPRQPMLLDDNAKLQFGASSRSFLFRAAPGASVPAAAASASSALTADEKRKLMWGGKRRAGAGGAAGGGSGAPASWDGAAAANALGGGAARQEKFLSLTGAKRAKPEPAAAAAAPIGPERRPGELAEERAHADEQTTSSAKQEQDAKQQTLFHTLERQFEQARGRGWSGRGGF
jgi:hypothetical protein